ncbi:hypothetical protein LWI28_013300 [Acer negundo]|uniref:Small auxin up regulated protein n=1 Tax=Acer negundo TaxID=4023 RepID=A0AAD5NIM0_ACENE|nr:hypothetical protein LWI28_013300 [Acer negundo]
MDETKKSEVVRFCSTLYSYGASNTSLPSPTPAWQTPQSSPSLGRPKHHHHILSCFFAVYVGEDRKRFLIPTRFLNLPIFVYLLKIAEKEYGFKCNGGIALPCEVDLFEEVLKFLVKDEKKYGSLEVSEFLKLIREMEFDSFSCKESPRDQSFMPLLLKS